GVTMVFGGDNTRDFWKDSRAESAYDREIPLSSGLTARAPPWFRNPEPSGCVTTFEPNAYPTSESPLALNALKNVLAFCGKRLNVRRFNGWERIVTPEGLNQTKRS